MNSELLTAQLAERVMGWTVAPDRFLMANRRWIPRWRFQPAKNLADAFRLLEQFAPDEYTMGADNTGRLQVRVRARDATGVASDESKARAITFAIARALGIEVGL